MQEVKGMGWLRTFFARREMRSKVNWNTCIWSPQKAAEQRFKENLVRHHKELFRIQTDAQIRQLAQMRTEQILKYANHAQYQKAMIDYELAFHRARTHP
jgi:hypothetical protein